jgi:hypothetical protein
MIPDLSKIVYNCFMVFSIRKVYFLRLFISIAVAATLSIADTGFCSQPAAEEQLELLLRQLRQTVNFENLQNRCDDYHGETERFSRISQAATIDSSDESAQAFASFVEMTFNRQNPTFTAFFSAFRAFGRTRQQHRHFFQNHTHLGPFTNHVSEAIAVNKERAAHYAEKSAGRTGMLSTFYTGMEYAIIPVAMIIDRWARHFNQQGIPVLANDFVSMQNIPAADSILKRRGQLDRHGAARFRKILAEARKQFNKTAMQKDFPSLRLQAEQALNQLKTLQEEYSCNLSMSIHLIESIGLAATNAIKLGHEYSGKTDCFYRVFILAQNAGLAGFSIIDIIAQRFHKENIGIITNDLPAIAFP